MDSLREYFITKCNDSKSILHLRDDYTKLDFTYKVVTATDTLEVHNTGRNLA